MDEKIEKVSSETYMMDCIEGMKQYSDKYFDLAIVDPPFGIGNFVQDSGNIRGGKVSWNNQTPTVEYFEELRRVSNNRIVFGANYYNCFDKIGGAIIWVKNQPMPNFSKAVIASCSFHKKIEIYEQTWTNFVQKGRTGIHPCEMPIDIYDWIFTTYTKEGQKVLDTHLGSGSSRIAAHKNKLNFVGFEIDSDYFDKQEKRFSNYILQQTLF